MDKQVKDHISGVASANLNAAEALFGIDANALKNARFSPEALAALKDLQADATFWAKNGQKIRQQIEVVVAGTAEKTITLGMIASAVNKYGKPIINAKYNAALDQKKFGNFLEEKKLQAQGQFGQEQARHATQMQFTQAQIKDQHIDFKAQAAMQMGSNAPFLAQPNSVAMPSGVNPSGNVGYGAAQVNEMPMGTDAIADNATRKGLFGVFGAIKRGVNKVRSWFGI
jgi:hypothetical protein